MLTFDDEIKLFVYLEPVDMRKSINGLSAMVADNFSDSLQSGNVFLFCNKSRDKVKGLFWHHNGFLLFYKRLEKGRFKIQKSDIHDKVSITQQQLSWLLAGLDFNLMHRFNTLEYSSFYCVMLQFWHV